MINYSLEAKCINCPKQCPPLNQLIQATKLIQPSLFSSSEYKRLLDVHLNIPGVTLMGFEDNTQIVRFKVNKNGCLGVGEFWVEKPASNNP